MQNYKAFFILTGIYLAMVVLSCVVQFAQLYSLFMSGSLFYYVVYACHIFVTGSIILTLKSFKENVWRMLPFYVSIIIGLTAFIVNLFFMPRMPISIIYYYSAQGSVFSLISLYMIVSCFFVKNSALETFFKIYAGALILSFAFSIVSRFLARVITMQQFGLVNDLRDILNLLPTIVILVLYYHLYTKASKFKQGDLVKAKVAFENVPADSNGMVTRSHPDSNFYEVEFFDQDGELLNVLAVAGSKIAHVKALDLQSRIEAFGK